jgi:hypothetical protein
MPVTVKKIVLWRTEVENKPGALAATLEPAATGGADLKVVMGYRHPATEGKATIEVFPITGRKLTAACAAVGLSASTIPTLLVEGDSRPGLAYNLASAIADSGINIAFWIAQVIGRKYSALIGFESDDDAKRATPAIKKAVAAPKPARKSRRG